MLHLTVMTKQDAQSAKGNIMFSNIRMEAQVQRGNPQLTLKDRGVKELHEFRLIVAKAKIRALHFW